MTTNCDVATILRAGAPQSAFARLVTNEDPSAMPIADRVTLTKAEGESTDLGNILVSHFAASLPLP
jgi:hypothetical protein